MKQILHPGEHKLAIAASVVIVAALTILGLVANSLQTRQSHVEHTVQRQEVKVRQLLCEKPHTRSCERHAYNVIVSCLAVPVCRRLLVSALIREETAPAPPASVVFGGSASPASSPAVHEGHSGSVHHHAHAPPSVPPSHGHGHEGGGHHGGHGEHTGPPPVPEQTTPAPAPAPSEETPGNSPEGKPGVNVCVKNPVLPACVHANNGAGVEVEVELGNSQK